MVWRVIHGFVFIQFLLSIIPVYKDFFKASNKLCVVDEYAVADAKSSKYKIAESVVQIKGKNIQIDTNNFPIGNETYYFLLVGQVSSLNGTKANLTFKMYVDEPFVKDVFKAPEVPVEEEVAEGAPPTTAEKFVP
mgnify:CR=1 FL=1